MVIAIDMIMNVVCQNIARVDVDDSDEKPLARIFVCFICNFSIAYLSGNWVRHILYVLLLSF